MATNRNVFASNTAGNVVEVIGYSSNTIIATIPVGIGPTTIATTPDGTQVYVCNAGDTSVSVIDTASNTVSATVTMPSTDTSATATPAYLAISPNGAYCVVNCASDPNNFGFINVISTVTNTVISSTNLTSLLGATVASSSILGITFSLDSSHAYCSFGGISGIGFLVFFDIIPTTTVLCSTSGSSVSNVITTDGLTIYSFCGTYNAVDVVDVATATVTHTIALSTTDKAGVLKGDNSVLYVAGAADIYVISTATNTITATLTGPSNTEFPPAILPTSSQVYFSDSGGSDIWILNTATNALTSLLAGSPTFGIVSSLVGDRVYVSGISVISTATNTIIASPSAAGDFLTAGYFQYSTPTPPTYPGSTFIPTLFIPQKGKIDDYTSAELMADWVAIEIWASRWLPPAPVLFFPRKGSDNPQDLDTNWILMEEWANQIRGLKAPYPALFVPRKGTNTPSDLDIDFLRIQSWANGIAHG